MLPNDIKKQYGVAPEGVSKKCFCIVLILPTRCELFQRLMADNGVDCSPTDRLWRSSSPAPTRTGPLRAYGASAAISSIPPSPPITAESSSALAAVSSTRCAARSKCAWFETRVIPRLF